MASFDDVVPSASEIEAMMRLHKVTAGRTERVAAILVGGRAVERSSWVDDAEVSEDDFERLLNEQAPAPDLDDADGKTFRTLDPGSRSAPLQRCSQCEFLPPAGTCLRCNGAGKIQVGSDDWEKCFACDGTGHALPCSVCGGSKRAVRVKIAFGRDVLRRFAHMFLPELSHSLREPLAAFFKQRTSVPDVLTVDLEGELTTADAYRGRRSRAEVRGHRADGAVALAKTYVGRVTRLPTFALVRAAAFAWPIALVVREGEEEARIAIVKDERGALHVLPYAKNE